MTIIDVTQTLPWNENGQKWKARSLDKIKRLVVHQALGTKTAEATNKFCLTNSPNIALGRGMPRIAYHLFIERSGSVYLCNVLTDVTAHVKNMNTNSVGICLGGFYNYGDLKVRDGDPPAAQMTALQELLEHLVKELKLTKTSVFTHNELQGKPSCPGNVAADLVKKFQQSTA
jgi:hypothetical protein